MPVQVPPGKFALHSQRDEMREPDRAECYDLTFVTWICRAHAKTEIERHSLFAVETEHDSVENAVSFMIDRRNRGEISPFHDPDFFPAFEGGFEMFLEPERMRIPMRAETPVLSRTERVDQCSIVSFGEIASETMITESDRYRSRMLF